MTERPPSESFADNVVPLARPPHGAEATAPTASSTWLTASQAPAPAEPAPPKAIEMEQALLGAILINPDALDRARDHVVAADFADDVHRQIFETMCARRDAGDAIDWKLLTAMLGDVDLGGVTVSRYLARLAAEATSVTGAADYARTVAHAARMRTVLEVAQEAAARMTDGSVHNPTAYAAQIIDRLDEVASAGLAEHVRRSTLAQSAAKVLARIDETRRTGEVRGAPYGVPSLDKVTLGMRAPQFIVLAGRPGMGKTAAALHIALSSARHTGPVGFVSLEMDDIELTERVLAALAYDPRAREEISYRAIAQAHDLSDEALWRLSEAEATARTVPIWIEQQPNLTLSQIAARARQMKLRAERAGTPMSALIVDHMGLVKPAARYAGNRVQEMTEISGGLKGLAKELGIPVVGLCQLNRAVENREDKRPQLSDLRDSGSIEQDADVVLGLFREAYYLEIKADRTDEEEIRLMDRRNVLEIGILKQRSGPKIRVECFCNIACNILAEMA
ncbi:DnaB-like helicase C-terminal domain-containing protein [Methylobacterium sp. CCH5-D2]|uniref:replicative DNA helicase n=1 Tax=Methylobacterium sp. CCH5-D2 TaxID=1768765 RepID=UPI0008321375|nr:DnaB-like helicase C-terminal domain-containing protein [Methylobacterium sp. CCH5-D2]